MLTILLGGFTAFGPLSMDLYLPAFPQLAADFGTGPAAVQLTLTADVLGLVVGQLVLGPLSDAYGRRRLLIGSALVCAVASVLCALAPTIGLLVLWRFLQGASGGGGIVQLGAGVHLISRWLQMKAGVTLAGAGKGITTIKAGPTFLSTAGNHGGHPGISTDNADNITIRNLTLDMSGDTNDGNLTGRTSEYCVDIRTSTNVLVSNVAVRNPYTYSIAAAGADHFRITGCDVTITSNGRYDQLDQIHVLNSNTGIIDNNLVDAGTSPDADDGLVAHTLGAGGTVHHIRYLNNKVRCGQGGHLLQAALGADGNTIHDILIADNELWGSTRGVMVGWYSTTTATVDKVSIDGNDFHDNGYAVDIATVGANLTNTTATNNRTHATGVLQIAAGTGNSVSGTTPY